MRSAVARTRNQITHARAAPDVSLAVVTYAPDEIYYRSRGDILKMSLDTMLEGAKGHKTELIIWDNGSTPKYKELILSYNPDVYIQSYNIGGYNGRRGMLRLARGTYTSIADDDILYSCDWLDRQLELFDKFPGVFSTSGCPRRFKTSRGVLGTVGGIAHLPGLTAIRGKMLPHRWMMDLNISLGGHAEVEPDGFDLLVTRNGVAAWVVKVDIQLMGKTEELSAFHNEFCSIIGSGNNMTTALKEAGKTQLSTYYRTAIHIGNFIDHSVLRCRKEMSKIQGPPELQKIQVMEYPLK